MLALGFPGDASGKEPACQCRRCNYEMCAGSLGWEDPLEKEWLPTPAFLPGESSWTEEPGMLYTVQGVAKS